MRQRTKNKISTFFLVLILLVLGIGYAYLSTTLSINGTTSIDRSVWNIYFDNVQVKSGSVSGSQVTTAPTIDTNKTTVSFRVNLKEPGEFYEFTVDAKNDGTIDAMIETINKTTNIPEYLSYIVTYSDGINIIPKQELNAGTKETYKVKVVYRTDIDPDDLPATPQSLNLSFSVTYVQKDDTSISIPHPQSFATDPWETIVGAVRSGSTDVYNLGDTRTINMGSLGTHTLRLVNKSTNPECSNSGFSQTACGFVIEFADIISKHYMNPSTAQYYFGTNIGGWPASDMRSYVSSTVYNSLPSDLKSIIIDTTVVSGHGSTTGETNFTSTDKLFLLSTKEVLGSYNGITEDTARDSSRQLDFYEANGPVSSQNFTVAIKKYNNTATDWWLRNAKSSFNDSFDYIRYDNGKTNYPNRAEANDNNTGVSPAFRIG